MEHEEEKPVTEIPPKWKIAIVAVILIIIIGLIIGMFRSKISGGGSRGSRMKHRWGARGGDCGCAGTPMP